MFLRCNPRCKKSDGSTEGSLDVERDEVVCKICGDDIANVSSFSKQSMKFSKDIVTHTKKAFMFDCRNCNKKVETVIINGVPYGKDCQTKNCAINVSDIMVSAIDKMSVVLKKIDGSGDGE